VIPPRLPFTPLRPIRSGKYKDYVIMGQLEGSGNAAGFISEGSILMTYREPRFEKLKSSLSKIDTMG